ncbi:unnamed protein product [Mytilus coruscus]|uniref:B box-type domain-containing protein n=1 Tax=Mytilus coruscus TaxID=42192 RepID=A0A6J8CV24_MYTCO|nr:unnamed protein product [Mytilus coruscus]
MSSDETNLKSNKNRKDLVQVPNKIQPINNISIALEQKINTSSKWARGCTITRKGEFIFTDYFNSNEKLVKLNAQCNTVYIIQLSSPYSAFDIEFINDNTVAVTTGKSVGLGKRRGISIVDLTNRNVIKFIDLPNYTYGITFDGISLICCVDDRDLHIISSIDYSITTVPNTILPWFSYVTTHACKIFFTNPNTHTVSCCLYNGTPIWEFRDENLLKTPYGITVDDKGNFFVVGRDFCNALVISSEGKYTKQILNKEDGLIVPTAIFFDKIGKQLLVTSDQKLRRFDCKSLKCVTKQNQEKTTCHYVTFRNEMSKIAKAFLLPSMATNTSVCSICDLRHVTSSSKHWCPECEEALCTDCSEHHSLSRGTRSHETIPISQYQSLPTFVTDIHQFCLYHNEKYQQYWLKLFIDNSATTANLVALNEQGNTVTIIQFRQSYCAFDVEYSQENTAAVTCVTTVKSKIGSGISIIDLTKMTETKFINIPGYPNGITYDGKSLICCVNGKDIHMMSCTDYSITTVPNTVLPKVSYVSTHANKIFFTNPDENQVTCCLYSGARVWEFSDEKVLSPIADQTWTQPATATKATQVKPRRPRSTNDVPQEHETVIYQRVQSTYELRDDKLRRIVSSAAEQLVTDLRQKIIQAVDVEKGSGSPNYMKEQEQASDETVIYQIIQSAHELQEDNPGMVASSAAEQLDVPELRQENIHIQAVNLEKSSGSSDHMQEQKQASGTSFATFSLALNATWLGVTPIKTLR